MSGQALRDLNVLPPSELDKKPDASVKGKVCIGNIVENHEKKTKVPTTVSDSSLNDAGLGNNVIEAGNLEVEYIDSENLTDLQDVDACLSTLLARLDSKEWVSICEALNNVRQLSLYHKERMIEMLGSVIPLIVKSLKNPRSAVCKTAIMTSADIFKVYGDVIIDSVDPLLVQLLLKSSQDKRFVCEAAVTALIAMTTWVSPSLLLPKLQPYLKNKNPRIRAKASMCFSRSVPRLGIEGIKSYGIDKLVQTAASQLSDQLPESREAARVLALELQSVYEKSQASPTEDSNEVENADSWESFCQAKLPPLSAQAIIRVTSTPKEALVAGC
ncbi:CLASP N-terminal domain-containing protein [Dioscorea alata]|uniref:CLASP N-terminal domain-containing protein n=1 Tax=Dioscorea alata TaxID=55571 RepID=A0ACB7UIR9_DIOAL|nr:CLASP N-terminal domain-containing protein [Dioscorea alata]